MRPSSDPRAARSSAESDPARAATSAGGHPLRPGRPPLVSTWIRTRAPGACCAMRSPSARRATPCHTATKWCQRPHLVPLDRAQKVPVRPGRPGRLAPAIRRRSSPRPRSIRRRGPPRRPRARIPWSPRAPAPGSDHHRRARCVRRTAARRAATSSLPKEGGHVEIVVTQVELVFFARGLGEDVHGVGGAGENETVAAQWSLDARPPPTARIRPR